jgi:hypothetical protein
MRGSQVTHLHVPRSDYVEGISPETVQTSLGRDIGHLNLKGARVNPQAPLGHSFGSAGCETDTLSVGS